MDKLQEFIKTYNGKQGVGTTLENTGQCTGLVMKWLVFTLNLPMIWGHAYSLLENANKDAYIVIPNTDDFIPLQGDVVVYNKAFNGTVGHTAICTGKGDTNTFEVFEQNNPLGSGCRLRTGNYSHVDGFIRPKIQEPVVCHPISKNEELIRKSSAYDETTTYLEQPLDAPIATVKSVIAGLRSRITDLGNKLTESNSELGNRADQVARLKDECQNEKDLRLVLDKKINDTLRSLNDTRSLYEGQLAGKQGVIDGLAKEKGALNNKVASLEMELNKLKDKTTQSLSLYDVILLLVYKLIPFLKKTKL